MLTVTIVLYDTIENNTKYKEQKIKKYIINNYCLLGMHAVFMGTTTASTPVVVMRRCIVMVSEKPEVVDKSG